LAIAKIGNSGTDSESICSDKTSQKSNYKIEI